jgi:hypothetical protein
MPKTPDPAEVKKQLEALAGAGDGIVVPTIEHYGRSVRQMPKECSSEEFPENAEPYTDCTTVGPASSQPTDA